MKRRRVRFTAAAYRHLKSERAWWIKNRDQRELFAKELDRALKLLAIYPAMRSREPSAKFRNLRRFLLRKTHCHVYYTFDDHEVIVRAIWGARRARRPVI